MKSSKPRGILFSRVPRPVIGSLLVFRFFVGSFPAVCEVGNSLLATQSALSLTASPLQLNSCCQDPREHMRE
ncbi:hypothetical protein HRI_003894500 [Hibiscus trionum]|uniref:Uncharacterized protein n=1 Tax=Hibiscus trionum TaxID=183268 RepID=A0A9W7ITC0_HIBTR|nr:hypothetical protein HRI_003894500 [Hibiscus trionum]